MKKVIIVFSVTLDSIFVTLDLIAIPEYTLSV